jgi:hypothetical protein
MILGIILVQQLIKVLLSAVYIFTIFFHIVATPNPLPVVSSPIPPLTVEEGVYFEYTIPENTFTDIQDGNTRQLTLQLLNSNDQVSIQVLSVLGHELMHSSFIYYLIRSHNEDVLFSSWACETNVDNSKFGSLVSE